MADTWENLEAEAEAGGMVEAAALFDYVLARAPQLRAVVDAARRCKEARRDFSEAGPKHEPAAARRWSAACDEIEAALRALDEVT